MGVFRFSNLPMPRHPGVRARIADSRKRFHCDLLRFWRRCSLGQCGRARRCLGDPHDCFRRQHAAMPRDHAAWLHAEILSGTTGTATAERALRAFGLSLPRKAAEAMPPDPASDDDASRRAARAPEVPPRPPFETLADLEKAIGRFLTGKLEPPE